MTLPEVLALLVIVVAAPLNIYVAVILTLLARGSSEVPVLRVQAVSWLSLTVIVAVFGFVFWNNGLNPPVLDLPQTQLLTRTTLLVFSVIPAVYWLRTVWRP